MLKVREGGSQGNRTPCVSRVVSFVPFLATVVIATPFLSLSLASVTNPDGGLVAELLDGAAHVGERHLGHEAIHPHLIVIHKDAQIVALHRHWRMKEAKLIAWEVESRNCTEMTV